jgi:hypothetical protein
LPGNTSSTTPSPFLADKPNESELSVRLLGDRKVMLFGADNADALRGIYLDGVVPDEFGDFKPPFGAT